MRVEESGGNRIADIRNAFFPSAGADSDNEDLAVGFTPRVCVDRVSAILVGGSNILVKERRDCRKK